MYKDNGISLIELLIALSICGCMACLAIPSLSELHYKVLLQSTAERLFESITLARLQAVSRNENATLVPNGGAWQEGWALFIDHNSNGQKDADEPLLLMVPPTDTAFTITATPSVKNYIRFAPDGRSYLHSGAFQAGTIHICHKDNRVQGRSLIINSVGRIRQGRQDCP